MSATFSGSSLRYYTSRKNPDDNFILHGKSASYWDKPAYLDNSQLADTPSRLGQHKEFKPENYKDRHYVKSLSDLASNLKGLSYKFQDSLRQSSALSTRNIKDESYLSLDETSENKNRLKSYENIGGKPLSPEESSWFQRSKSYHKKNEFWDREEKDRILHVATLQTSGEENVDKYMASTRNAKQNYSVDSEDILVKQFFPVTFSFTTESLATEKEKKNVFKHSIRPKSALPLSLQKHGDQNDVDKMYLMNSEAPLTASAPPMILSPYQMELAELRMERLRMEEERLLEIKRLEELERTRGPKAKWYESCGPDFHYEAHKNTEMIRHEKKWDDLVTYREKLIRSSNEFRKSHCLEVY